MPIRLIALDLDGTLVNSRWEISTRDLEALSAASAQGVKVVVVTGRRPRAAAPYVAKIPFPVTTITSNGALISTTTGDVAYQDFLPRNAAVQVLTAVEELRPYTVVIFNLPGRGQVTMQENASQEGPLGWYLRTSMDHLLMVPDLPSVVTSDPVQVMIGGPPAHIKLAETLLNPTAIRENVQLTWTIYPERNIALLDIMNRGCTKGRALRFWAGQCGIPAAEVMAMGDNFNDLEMLEFAGLPVVMGNHIAGLHRPGWAKTTPCDDCGVADAIERYVLKNLSARQ